MQVPISRIQVRDGRRRMDAGHVRELEDSIRELGLLNPITIDRGNVLIAGLHRLEAAKRLGWQEIECTVSSLDGLQAELAEIDENIVRSDLPALEYGEALLRRKEVYEALHPETKHGGDRKSEEIKTTKCRFDNVKSFAQDTAEKLGVVPRTVERQIQTVKNLAPEAKEIIRDTDMKISKKAAMKLSRLEPAQQKEAAALLAAKEIRTVDEYMARMETVESMQASISGKLEVQEPSAVSEHGIQDVRGGHKDTGVGIVKPDEKVYSQESEYKAAEHGGRLQTPGAGDTERKMKGQSLGNSRSSSGEPYIPQEGMETSFRDLVAELKNPDKDCSGTPDSFLGEYAAFVRKFHREIAWYEDPYYDLVYPHMDKGQLAALREMTDSICSAAEDLFHKVERMMKL